jgi:formiminotetrahydrofolate cyclodeaminase
MMTEMSMKQFLAELSSSAPVPGGGGACGYVAAVGMSLGTMVANLTTGKKKYAEYQEEIEGLIDETNRVMEELAECMDKDAESFAPLAAAYGLPKSTEEEVAHKEKVMEAALVTASEAPLAMMEKILEAMKLLDRLSIIGSRIAISDVGVGVKLCQAAMGGASLNVYINTNMMKDPACAAKMNARADELVKTADEMAEATFSRVMEIIRK